MDLINEGRVQNYMLLVHFRVLASSPPLVDSRTIYLAQHFGFGEYADLAKEN